MVNNSCLTSIPSIFLRGLSATISYMAHVMKLHHTNILRDPLLWFTWTSNVDPCGAIIAADFTRHGIVGGNHDVLLRVEASNGLSHDVRLLLAVVPVISFGIESLCRADESEQSFYIEECEGD